MKAANLALKFLLELVAFAGLAYWGASEGVAAAIVAPVAAILVWSQLCAPRSPRRLPTTPRIVLELIVFALAAIGLVAAGATAVGIAFAVVAALNALGLQLWGQWEG